MAKFLPPSDFDFSLPDAWPAWKQRFSCYRMSSRLNSKDEPVQVSMTLYCMGPAAESAFAQLKFDGDSDRDKYEEVMAKLDTYFCPALNVFHQRTMFEQCVHQPGELSRRSPESSTTLPPTAISPTKASASGTDSLPTSGTAKSPGSCSKRTRRN